MRISRLLLSAILVIASGALAAAFLYLAVGRTVPVPVGGAVGDGSPNGRERGWFTTRGFYRPERDASRSSSFSWTPAHAELRVPNIDRSRPYRVGFRIRAGRGPDTEPPPHLIVSVDGVPRLTVESSNEPTDYAVDVPGAATSSLVVAIDVSDTFVPGPGDRRELGVIVDAVTIAPVDGGWRPTVRVAFLTALATMMFTAVAMACGFAPGWTFVVGVLVAAAHAWLLARDAAFLGPYVSRLLNIAIGTGAAGVVVMSARRWSSAAGAPDWSLAVGLAIVAAALKMAFFGHPNVALADSIFQVHRAQNVVAGQYFFTSITPRPFFEFPYAVALYVAALPLWDFFPSELDRVRLLRGVTVAADALVGVAMYLALRRAWPTRGGAALAFALLWPFARSPVNALCTSNLTNLFGQGLFGTAMAIVAWMAATGRRGWALSAAATALFAGAYLSHFSTASVGVPLALTAAGLLVVGGTGDTKRLGVRVIAMVVVAAAISYVVYYSHFHGVYRDTLDRVVAGDGAGEARSMAAPLAVKVSRWQHTLVLEFGWPALLAAAAGAVWALRTPRGPAWLVLAAWGLTWLGFTALGIVTPIEMRANLAAAPFVLAMASFAIGQLAGRSAAGVAAASLVAALIAWDGFTRWLHCLTG